MINVKKERPVRLHLLEFLFEQICEKLIRLESFLKEARAEVSDREIYLLTALDKFLQLKWVDIERLEGRIRVIEQGTFENRDFLLFFSHLGNLGRQIRDNHEYLRWVATPWVELETYTFLDGVFQDEQRYQSVNGTIVFNHEYAFDTADKRRGGAVDAPAFALPRVERSNPLMWAILVHEVCHVLSERSGLNERVLREVQGKIEVPREASEPLRKWVQEFAADFLSARFLGPAYLYALIGYAVPFIRKNLNVPSETHPPVAARVNALKGMMQDDWRVAPDRAPAFSMLELYETRLLVDREIGETYFEDASAIEHVIAGPTDGVLPNRKVADLIPTIVARQFTPANWSFRDFSTEDFERSRLISDRLQAGVLISSFVSESKLRDARAAMESGSLSPKEWMELLASLDEVPNSTREIINAGWIVFESKRHDWAEELLRGAQPFAERVEHYRKRVEDWDAVLQKSIESAVVHGVFAA